MDTPGALRQTFPGRLFEVIASDHRRAARALANVAGVEGVQMFGERAHVRMKAEDEQAASRRLQALSAAGVETTSVRPVTASLEDIFVARLGEGQS
jgi:hypothetical protein